MGLAGRAPAAKTTFLLDWIVFGKHAKGFLFLTKRWKPMSHAQFSLFVKWVFQTYANKNWSQNTIRSIKVSSTWSPGVNPIKLAEEMGHSLKTAVLHYKK